MQFHAIPCNTIHHHAIPCNTMQYHAIPWMLNNCWRSVPLPCGQYMAIFYSRKALAMPGNREDSVVRFVWGREGRRNFSLQKSKHGVSGPSFLRIQVLKTEFLVSFSLEISSLFSGYVLNLRVNWTVFSWISWIHRPKLFSATLKGNNACRNQHRCKEMTLQELQNYIPFCWVGSEDTQENS